MVLFSHSYHQSVEDEGHDRTLEIQIFEGNFCCYQGIQDQDYHQQQLLIHLLPISQHFCFVPLALMNSMQGFLDCDRNLTIAFYVLLAHYLCLPLDFEVDSVMISSLKTTVFLCVWVALLASSVVLLFYFSAQS